MKHGWMEMGEGEEDIEGSRRKATIEEEAEETERRKRIEFVQFSSFISSSISFVLAHHASLQTTPSLFSWYQYCIPITLNFFTPLRYFSCFLTIITFSYAFYIKFGIASFSSFNFLKKIVLVLLI